MHLSNGMRRFLETQYAKSGFGRRSPFVTITTERALVQEDEPLVSLVAPQWSADWTKLSRGNMDEKRKAILKEQQTLSCTKAWTQNINIKKELPHEVVWSSGWIIQSVSVRQLCFHMNPSSLYLFFERMPFAETLHRKKLHPFYCEKLHFHTEERVSQPSLPLCSFPAVRLPSRKMGRTLVIWFLGSSLEGEEEGCGDVSEPAARELKNTNINRDINLSWGKTIWYLTNLSSKTFCHNKNPSIYTNQSDTKNKK